MRCRCPHCHNPIELIKDESFSDIECPSCGSHFHLISEERGTLPHRADVQRIAHFDLMMRVGAGHFGTVWKARDTELDRIVALKVPRLEGLEESAKEQFFREARAAAQTSHPNIIQVHEVGREDETVFIVSDFIDGPNLADHMSVKQMTVRESAELCVTIASALHAAHESGVVHRDLKPQNIMMDADGMPFVGDFGLAKRDAPTEITMTVDGAILGTPAYMPPEQAKGLAHLADRRADIYSLGVILYQLMTGELPFRGRTQMLILQIQRDEPSMPRKLNNRVPRDLETICMKCLEKEPAARYATSLELAEELSRFLAGKPVTARPITVAHRTWRWCRRNPAISSLTASLIVSLLVLAIAGPLVAVNQANLATQNGQLATKERAARGDAESKSQQLSKQSVVLKTQLQVATAMRLAVQAEEVGDEFPVRGLLLGIESVEATRLHDGTFLPLAQQTLTDRLANIGGRPLVGHSGGVTSAAFFRKGRWLATGGADRTIRLWDLSSPTATSAATILRGHQGRVTTLQVSPDDRWLISLTYSGPDEKTLRLWDLNSTDPKKSAIELKGHERRILKFSISRDSRWLVSASIDKTARLWDLSAADPAASMVVLRGHEKGLYQATISKDNRWIATASQDKTARLWNLAAADPATSSIVLKGHEDGVYQVSISQNSRWLTTSSFDKTVRLWDLSAKDIASSAKVLKGQKDQITVSEISPDSRWLVTAGLNQTARLWDLSSQDPSKSVILLPQKSDVFSAQFSADGNWLVTTGAVVRLWSLKSKDPVSSMVELRGQEGGTFMSHITADSQRVITASDRTAQVWEINKKNGRAKILRGHESLIWAIRTTADSRTMFTLGRQDARLWNLQEPDASSAAPVALSGHGASMGWAVSPNNRWLVTRSPGPHQLWNLAADDPASSGMLLGQPSDKGSLFEFSADNRWLVTVQNDKLVRLYDLSSASPGTSPAILAGHQGQVIALAFSPDNGWLVTSSKDKTARLWNLKSQDPAASSIALRGEHERMNPRVMSDDGRWLVTPYDDNSFSLWDMTAVDPAASLVVLKGHKETISTAMTSKDGHWLVTTSMDGGVRLWDLRASDVNASGTDLLSAKNDAKKRYVYLQLNNQRLVAARDKTVHLWNLRAPEPATTVVVFKEHKNRVNSLVLGPMARWLVTGSRGYDSTLRLYDLSAKNSSYAFVLLADHKDRFVAVETSPNGRWLATAGRDKTVRLYDLSTEEPAKSVVVLRGLNTRRSAIAGLSLLASLQTEARLVFSADSRRLIASSERTIQSFDLNSDDVSSSAIYLRRSVSGVPLVSLTPNGRRVIAKSRAEPTVLLWDLDVDRLIQRARLRAGRKLTPAERKQYLLE